MEQINFSIKLQGPFRLDLTTWAFRRRKQNIVDQFDGTNYSRVIVLDSQPIVIIVKQLGSIEKPVLKVRLAGCRKIVKKGAARDAISNLLGTNLNLQPFYALAKDEPLLGGMVERYMGFKPPRFASIYEALLNAICFQQLSLHVGVILMNRLAKVCGRRFDTDFGSVFSLPEPDVLMKTKREILFELGLSNNKVRALMELAERFMKSESEIKGIEKLEDEAAIEKLMTFRGIGRWSAEYVLLRGLGRIHIFPGDDVGFQNGLQKWLKLKGRPESKKARKIVSKWFPFGGMIYFHMLLERLNVEGYLDDKKQS